MTEKNIELELRAEVSPENRESLKKHLARLGILDSHTKRLSVMYFGKVGVKKIDIRVRITNGECEAVIKTGSFGSHDRTESSLCIDSMQFLGIVKIFAQFGFTMKVGERETFNYKLPDGVIISLVSAGPIAYIELEKMSSQSDLNRNHDLLKGLSLQLGLQLLNSEEAFDELCKRLTEKVDWPFQGSHEDYEKLQKLLSHYTKD